MQQFNKLWMSLLPLAVMVGGYFGMDVTPEWWSAAAVVVAPALVWLVPNRG